MTVDDGPVVDVDLRVHDGIPHILCIRLCGSRISFFGDKKKAKKNHFMATPNYLTDFINLTLKKDIRYLELNSSAFNAECKNTIRKI